MLSHVQLNQSQRWIVEIFGSERRVQQEHIQFSLSMDRVGAGALGRSLERARQQFIVPGLNVVVFRLCSVDHAFDRVTLVADHEHGDT